MKKDKDRAERESSEFAAVGGADCVRTPPGLAGEELGQQASSRPHFLAPARNEQWLACMPLQSAALGGSHGAVAEASSPDSSEVAQQNGEPPQQFLVGDAVHVWSNSKNAWIEDGVVQDVIVQGQPVTLAGSKLPVGSLMVTFDGSSGVKWVLPRHVHTVLRKAPRPCPDVLRTSGTASGSAVKSSQADAAGVTACGHELDDTLVELRELEKRCEVNRCLFTDPDFRISVAGRVSSWSRPQDIGRHDGQILDAWEPWKMLFLAAAGKAGPDSSWHLFRGPPCADDVQQGELGDCWFLSSLAALAEFQDGRWVRALLPGQDSVNAHGVYLVRLCLGGRWRNVIIDDQLPCIGGGRYFLQLAYCVTKRLQLWASLIEKAFAKACGSYQAIVGGEAGEALSILTGWPCTLIRFDREDFDEDILWATLCSSRDTEFLMTCSTAHVKVADAASLVPFHVYSLLCVYDIDDIDKGQVRLLKIRNPHNKLKWQGAWSDASSEWSPLLREKLGCLEGGIPGVFFMSLPDFLDRFVHCTICRIRSHEWHEARLELCLPNEDVPCVGVVLETAETTECSLSLAQPEERIRSGPLCETHVDQSPTCMGFVLLRRETSGCAEAVAAAHMRSRSTVSADCWLQPRGAYILVPLSLHIGAPLVVSCACVGSRHVSLKKHRLKREAVRAAWSAWTRGNDPTGGEQFHGAILYMGKADGGAIVALAENRGTGYFGVELSISSLNLRFSRASPTTVDWIAPGHGLILQVAVPDGSSGGSVSWRSAHTFYMKAVVPETAWHSPSIHDESDSLHTAFAL